MSVDLSPIVKAYDIRGIVPDQLDAQRARALGAALVRLLRAESPVPAVLIAHDMRDSSPGLAEALAAGVTGEGADGCLLGLGSTDMLYFGAGIREVPGVMVTASHNPAQYNGIKLCRAGARPIGADSGLVELRAIAEELLAGRSSFGTGGGRIHRWAVLADYARFLRDLVPLAAIRPLSIVVDAGNGMAGHTVPAVLGSALLDPLPLEIIPLYFELDGTFPNHEANPLEPKNLVDVQAAVRAHGADLGLAFDGDADRCFVVDERGEPVSPSAITALVAQRELGREPGGTVIHNLITSQAVPEIVAESGGRTVRTRVGHSYIKAEMARTGAIFGGEHSAHYYFKSFWNADTGMLAAMHVIAALGSQDQPLSALVAGYQRYVSSGEINSVIADPLAALTAVKRRLGDSGSVDDLDGLTIQFSDGAWINVRPSNTEPLLRLNVEAPDTERMAALRDQVLAIIRS